MIVCAGVFSSEVKGPSRRAGAKRWNTLDGTVPPRTHAFPPVGSLPAHLPERRAIRYCLCSSSSHSLRVQPKSSKPVIGGL